MKPRHKNQSDENFPVASLFIAPQLRPLVNNYYAFARAADDIADSPRLSSAQKIQQLEELENIFLGLRKYKGKKLAFANRLRHNFENENLSTSLVTDLMVAFRRDAEGFEYQTWGQLTDYCRYSAAPVGRFMLAIHDESPSTYLPGASLCTALQIVNHLQDIKYDWLNLRRLYLPSDLMQEYDVSSADLEKSQSTPQLQKLITRITSLTRGLLKEGALLPIIIRSRRLRFQVCIILSLTNIMLKKIEKGDLLSRELKLSRWDWIRGAVGGIFRGLFTKTRTLGVGYEQH